MTAGVEVLGVGRLKTRLSSKATELQKNLRAALVKAGNLVAGTAKKKILRDPHTGEIYGNHQASAPGESPANDLGNLARGIKVVKEADFVLVVSTAEYSAALEFGTKNIAPRPFLGPSLQENKEKIKELLRDANGGGEE